MNYGYSKVEGLKKTLKNVLVTYGVPAVLYFLNSYNAWLPTKYVVIAAPFVAAVCYFIKNWVGNQ